LLDYLHLGQVDTVHYQNSCYIDNVQYLKYLSVMGRGGKRENSGRRSNWLSSNQTKAIRVPEWMINDLIAVAKLLDEGKGVGEELNRNIYKEKIDSVELIIEKWQSKIPTGNPNTPRWKNTITLLSELIKVIENDRD
jgi:hypothetical protein